MADCQTDCRLTEEIEVLESIYIDELDIKRNECGQPCCISLLLHPATGDDHDKKYVCMTLILNLPDTYPDEIPEIVIKNPRGIAEEELQSLHDDMISLAEERREGHMLYEIIEMAKESLTDGNIPHCPCAICMEHFVDGDKFTRTECYHFYHVTCLAHYIRVSLLTKEIEVMAKPKHKDTEENKVFCPVCREEMIIDHEMLNTAEPEQDNSLKYEISPEIKQWQADMAVLLERQKEKGGIIDVEAEKNRYLLTENETVTLPVTDTPPPKDNSKMQNRGFQGGRGRNSSSSSLKQDNDSGSNYGKEKYRNKPGNRYDTYIDDRGKNRQYSRDKDRKGERDMKDRERHYVRGKEKSRQDSERQITRHRETDGKGSERQISRDREKDGKDSERQIARDRENDGKDNEGHFVRDRDKEWKDSERYFVRDREKDRRGYERNFVGDREKGRKNIERHLDRGYKEKRENNRDRRKEEKGGTYKDGEKSIQNEKKDEENSSRRVVDGDRERKDQSDISNRQEKSLEGKQIAKGNQSWGAESQNDRDLSKRIDVDETNSKTYAGVPGDKRSESHLLHMFSESDANSRPFKRDRNRNWKDRNRFNEKYHRDDISDKKTSKEVRSVTPRGEEKGTESSGESGGQTKDDGNYFAENKERPSSGRGRGRGKYPRHHADKQSDKHEDRSRNHHDSLKDSGRGIIYDHTDVDHSDECKISPPSLSPRDTSRKYKIKEAYDDEVVDHDKSVKGSHDRIGSRQAHRPISSKNDRPYSGKYHKDNCKSYQREERGFRNHTKHDAKFKGKTKPNSRHDMDSTSKESVDITSHNSWREDNSVHKNNMGKADGTLIKSSRNSVSKTEDDSFMNASSSDGVGENNTKERSNDEFNKGVRTPPGFSVKRPPPGFAVQISDNVKPLKSPPGFSEVS